MAAIKVRAKIVAMGPGGAWAFIYPPKSASRKLGARGRVPIRGTVNGFPFRSSAFPTGDGTHEIAVNKAIQAGARAKPGEAVEVRIEVDEVPRTVRVPADVKEALATAPKARANFERLAWSHRKAYVDWIVDAKRPETPGAADREGTRAALQGPRIVLLAAAGPRTEGESGRNF